jgi:glycosyltransferase involved in cell wall biosynthesis
VVTGITPLVLTFDEAPNIGRCLERLTWASRVVVLDSGSRDDTPAIVRRFPNADLHTRAFDDHTSQWNFGLSLVTTPLVLALDADYRLSDAMVSELRDLRPDDGVDAWFASFRYCLGGRPLRGSLYPPRAVLFRRERCRYEADGHTQRLAVPGQSRHLTALIDHDDRKPLDRWMRSQIAYARLEAGKLSSAPAGELGALDRLRRTIVLAPPAVFVYTLFVKGTALNGWRGLYYALQRAVAESLLSLCLLDRRLHGPHEDLR